jgi:hypothetical protein
MSLEALVSKYIACAETVMKKLKRAKCTINVTEENVTNILSYVNNYLEDAKYYKDQKSFETSLASVVYCEGLLDALRLLGAVKFEWPKRAKRKE